MLFTQCTVLLRVYIKIVRYDGRVLTTTKLYITTQDVSKGTVFLKGHDGHEIKLFPANI